LLIAWAGLRGASSSVFAITAVASGVALQYNLFHIVFMVSVFSVAIQGTLLPWVAEKLDMVDNTIDVRKTFNDYEEDSNFTLMKVDVFEGHEWVHRSIKEIPMPPEALALKIRRNGKNIVTRGDTVIQTGDTVVWIVPGYKPEADEKLEEISIDKEHPWCNLRVVQLMLPQDTLIAMVIREHKTIIPDGHTMIRENDRVVIYH
jgi:cell volume regulation protein A